MLTRSPSAAPVGRWRSHAGRRAMKLRNTATGLPTARAGIRRLLFEIAQAARCDRSTPSARGAPMPQSTTEIAGFRRPRDRRDSRLFMSILGPAAAAGPAAIGPSVWVRVARGTVRAICRCGVGHLGQDPVKGRQDVLPHGVFDDCRNDRAASSDRPASSRIRPENDDRASRFVAHGRSADRQAPHRAPSFEAKGWWKSQPCRRRQKDSMRCR